MVVKRFRGDAPAVSQVDTVQITFYDAATTYVLRVGTKTVSAVGDTDAATTAVALAAAWNASTITEFTRVTANAYSGTTPTDTITLTGDTPGMPFTANASVSGGTVSGTIGVVTNVTPSAGRNHADTPANWDPSGLPANGDDILFDNTATSCLYGVDTGNWPGGAPNLNSVTITASFTGLIGLPEFTATGEYEYRDQFFILAFQTTGNEFIAIGYGDGPGSGRIKLYVNDLTANLRIDVYSTGARLDAETPSLLIGTGTQDTGSGKTTTLNVSKGDVRVTTAYNGSGVITTLNVGFVTALNTDTTVEIDSGATPGTIYQYGGTITTFADVTSATISAGTFVLAGSATIGTLTVTGGTCYYDSNGATSTMIIVTSGATLDFRRDQRPVTVAQMDLYEGATVYDTGQRVTLTNGFDTIQCGLLDVTVDFGGHRTWTPSAI